MCGESEQKRVSFLTRFFFIPVGATNGGI